MRRAIRTGSGTFAALLVASSLGAQTASKASATVDLERRFDASIVPAEMGGWMKTMAAEPNHVGSAHNKANAEREIGRAHV